MSKKKRMFKHIIAVFCLAAVLVTMLCQSVFAVKIDGIFETDEWQNASSSVIISRRQDSNSGTYFAKMYWFVDSENHILRLAFDCAVDDIDLPGAAIGVLVSVNGGEYLKCLSGNAVDDYVHEDYLFEAAYAPMDFNFYICEMLIGVKNGFDSSIVLQLRFSDAEGELSNVYSIPLFPQPTQASETTVAPTKPPKTTVAKTTKPKRTTVIEITEKQTKVAKTTAAPKTTKQITTKVAAATIPTSKPPTTVKATAKEKVTIATESVFLTKSSVITTTVTELSATLSESQTEVVTSPGENAYKKKRFFASAFSVGLLFSAVTVAVIASIKREEESQT